MKSLLEVGRVMSLVIICRNPKVTDDETTRRLLAVLPAIIAEVLDTPDDPDGRLRKEDVEILVMQKQ